MENATSSVSVSLSQEELFVLLTYLRAKAMLGLNGTVLDDLSEKELRMILSVAERALVAREFLVPGDDDQEAGLQITPALLAVVGPCVKPQKTLIVTYDRPNRPRESFYFHQAASTLVSHTIPLSGIHQFATVEDSDPIQQIIVTLLDLDSQAAPMAATDAIHAPQAIITQARDVATGENGDSPAGVLTKSGLSDEFANAFAATLVDMQINITLVFLDYAEDGTANADGFTLLVGPNGCWRLEPDEEAPRSEAYLIINPLSAADADAAVAGLVQRFHQ